MLHSFNYVQWVFYIVRTTDRLLGMTAAIVAATAFGTSPPMGELHASVVVPAPVEGWKVGDTFPAGSGQFVGKSA